MRLLLMRLLRTDLRRAAAPPSRAATCAIGKNLGEIFKTHPGLRDITAVPTYPKAGSVSFHNGLTAHGAAANFSPQRRRAMTCALMPDGATFNGQQNVFTDGQMAKYKPGDALNDDTDNPLLYSARSEGVSFPPGLPNLRFQGHHAQPMTEVDLSHSGVMLGAAKALGYVERLE